MRPRKFSNFAKTTFYLDGLIKKFSHDFGKDFHIIYAHWPELVGGEIAGQTTPIKIMKIKDKRILQVSVDSPSIGMILEYGKIVIKDKINSLLGRDFIDNIVFLYSSRG